MVEATAGYVRALLTVMGIPRGFRPGLLSPVTHTNAPSRADAEQLFENGGAV